LDKASVGTDKTRSKGQALVSEVEQGDHSKQVEGLEIELVVHNRLAAVEEVLDVFGEENTAYFAYLMELWLENPEMKNVLVVSHPSYQIGMNEPGSCWHSCLISVVVTRMWDWDFDFESR
jgi:hypothetical protein